MSALAKHIVIVSLCFVFLPLILRSQTVGLVLSGGGSKGLSHIGVLKALEENEIPIDYITGTSMGAIIGGLYASGYSPEEMLEILRTDILERWTSGELDNQYIYYFKMPDKDASWINLNFDYDQLRGKIRGRLPTNMFSPHQMNFALLEIFAKPSAASDYDFDQLLVPFRCVASDIEANEPVVFSNGQLGDALRASSTYPFIFKPVSINGRLLFDGGIYNNFPSDIMMQEFNPDIIIGSKAASNYESPDSDDVISQLQNMIVSKTDYSLSADSGILIEPELPSKVNVLDFTDKLKFVDSGYMATLRVIEDIHSLIDRRVKKEAVDKKRQDFRASFHPVFIDSVIITGLRYRRQIEYVRSELLRNASYITLPKLKQEYFKLLSDDKIKDVYPSLLYDTSHQDYQLFMDVGRGDHFSIGVGGNISSKAITGAYLGFQYRYFGRVGLDFTANGYFGQFYSSAMIQPRLDIPGRFPFYLALNYTYNHWDYFRTSIYFFEDKEPSYLIQNETHVGIDLGFPASGNAKIVNGYSTGYTKDEYYQANTFTRLDTSDRTYFNFFEGRLGFEINSLNYKQFPDKGVRLLLRLKYLSGEEKTIPGSTSSMEDEILEDHRWFQFKLLYDNYFKQFGPVTIGLYGELLLSNEGLFSNYTATLLRSPAFAPIPEMNTLFLPNYRAQNYVGLGAKTNFKLYKQLNLRLEGYLFQPYEELASDEEGNAVRRKELSFRSYIASATLLYRTPIAPISLSFNYYDRAEQSFSVFFNIGFIIFNRDVTR